MSNQELCDVLLKWLKTFQLDDREFYTVDDLTDGVVMAQILHQIAPEWFSKNWLSKIKIDTGDNWRLKVSNLKKIIEAVSDYYLEYVNQNVNLVKPDAIRIGEHKDIMETVKLLQLILGCAVNCNKKQEYIKYIMCMEESVQNVIMQLIQELETLLGSTAMSFTSHLNADADTPLHQLITELQTVTETKEKLSRRCVELENQLTTLQEERLTTYQEKKLLEERLERTINDLSKDNMLRKQIDYLKEEIFKLETTRDDYRLKLEMQEKEMCELQHKFDALQRAAAEARHLKDEVDILREDADKAEKLESAVKCYKKKMEELSELKKEMKLLEEKNLAYVQQTLELEEELKKANTWKTQAEMYKKQIVELRGSLDEETKKLDKIEFENVKNQEKLNALQKEKERLILERDSLKEANEELLCNKLQLKDDVSNNSTVGSDASILSNGISSVIELKRELVRLQHENTLLKINQKQSDDEKLPLLQAMFDDTTQHNEQLRNECRLANQRILQLEAELKDLQQECKNPCDTGTDASQNIKELNEQLLLEKGLRLSESAEKDRLGLELKHLKSILFDALAHKDQEYEELEEKYRKCVEKARCVAKSLEYNEGLSIEEHNELSRNKVVNRSLSDTIEEMESKFKQTKLVKETEEKLIVSAFFNLTQKKLQECVDHRLTIASNSITGSAPFLIKQRQSAIRRIPLTLNPK